jgi:hypothetical protein
MKPVVCVTAAPLFLLRENTEKKYNAANRTTKKSIIKKGALPLHLAQLGIKKLA